MQSWSPNSWRNFPAKQQPKYLDQNQLQKVEGRLATFPPLVSINEIEDLKAELALVAKGEAFLLQGGDCAESFTEFSHANLKSFFRTVMQMTVALMYGLKKPIVKVGRIAGQYAKPRSDENETINGVTIPSYRGDIINSIEFDEKARVADPKRLIEAYFYSAASLNYLRSLALGGYASLHNINRWNKEFALGLRSKDVDSLVEKINQALKFVTACGIDTDKTSQFNSARFYTSHEALLLNYEEPFIKRFSDTGKFYNLSSHLLWIGDRTRGLDQAHVEMLRGIANPIAFKVGPSITKEDLCALIEKLNPQNEAGKITLISRMGAGKVESLLPPLVEAVKRTGFQVIWSCDPMHGNTIKSANGYKTRKFDDILSEIKSFFNVHRAAGTYAGGVHFELTGQDVTECLGGHQQIAEINLADRYHTHCDPRLNSSQSIELAFRIIEEF